MKTLVILAAAASLWAAGSASAQVYAGPYGPGGTYNVYRVITTASTWAAADAAAKAAPASSTGLPSLAGNTATGHLVQISSEDENTFVAMIATIMPGSGNSSIWLGLNDNNAEQGSNQTGWEWSGTLGGAGTNGEQVLGTDSVYSAWAPGEPNNSTTENAGEMRNDGRWNDNKHNLSTTTRRYVIEWEIAAAAPPEGTTQYPVYYSAPFGPSGTYNLYKLVAASQNFDTARDNAVNTTAGSTGVAGAAAPPLADLTGHLVTIGSALENHFVYRIGACAGNNTISTWLGASDDPGYDAQASESGTSKTEGWVWIDRANAEPFTYQKFDSRYPVNAEQPDNAGGTESVIELKGSSFWNDITPASGTLRRYVVEWETGSATPLSGAPVVGPILPGPTPALANAHSTTAWAIKEQRGSLAANLINSLGTVYGNTGTATEGTRPVMAQTDNAVSGSTGRSTGGTFWPKFDLVGDQAGTDDNNYTVFGKAKLQLDGTGPYTINVHSDDGFLCRISGATPGAVTITQVSGLGMQDPGDSAFYFPFGTGDSNTRAVFTVAAPGEYEVEYIGWDGTSGSYQEVSWCTGAAPNDWDGDWQLLGGPFGGTPVLADAGSFNAPAPAGAGWSIRYVDPAGGTTSIFPTVYSASQALQSAVVTNDTTSPVVNFADPNNGGNRGYFTADLPQPGDTGADDNNYVWGGRVLFTVDQAGIYTIGCHADDSVAIRLTNGAKWRGRTWSTGNQGHIDSNDSSVMWWFIGSGDSNIRAAAYFPAAGSYEIQLLHYEGTGGSAVELYAAPGVQLSDGDTSAWRLIGNPSTLTPLLPAVLAGAPVSTGGQWGTRYLSNSGVTMLSLTEAVAALQDTVGDNIYGTMPVINFSDPDNPGTTGLFGGDLVIPGDAEFLNDDDVAFQARATVNIPTSGLYTFGVRASDGFALRINGQAWINRNGSGGIDPADSSTLAGMPGTTGLSDLTTRGLIQLNAGVYSVDFISFDRGRDFMGELYAIPGNFVATGEFAAGTANTGIVNINASDAWRLVGHKGSPDPVGVIGVLDPGWSMSQTVALTGTTVPAGWGSSASQTDAWFETTAKVAPVNKDMINSRDPAGGTGLFPNDYPNPNDVASTDDNFYVTRFEGQLTVPVAGVYNVGWQGDDGGYFEFLKPVSLAQPEFTRVVANAIISAFITDSSDGGISSRIQLDAGGGHTRTSGEIALEAGVYPVRIQWFEGTGGSYFEVFTTPSVADARIIRLITKGGDVTFADTDGLQLVDTSGMVVTSVSLTGNQFSFTFTSIPGAKYVIESSTVLNPAWTVVNGALDSQGTTTTWTGTVNPAAAPNRQFFRAKLGAQAN